MADWSHDPGEDLRGWWQAEAEDTELESPSGGTEVEVSTRLRMDRNL